jgi:hypothetical protein
MAGLRRRLRALALALSLCPLAAHAGPGGSAVPAAPANPSPNQAMPKMPGKVRIAYLHHSTGEAIWNGGVPEFIASWNAQHGTAYEITELTYPATTGGVPKLLQRFVSRYPWDNYPYDYWNLWVKHAGSSRDRRELNLDDLAGRFDVIVFKHCFPVSGIQPDGPSSSVSSDEKTLGNYRAQYEALKARLHQFPSRRFIVWTGAALVERSTNPQEAERARRWADWVKNEWDRPGDNVFVWDFYGLQTEGGLYFQPRHAMSPTNSHPNPAFSRAVAPLIGRRIVDVIEGRGDAADLAAR